LAEQIVIAGATGLVGGACLEHFAARFAADASAVSRVTGVSRRGLDDAPPGTRVEVLDLTDRPACEAFAKRHEATTRLIYAALHEKPGLYAGWFETDQIATNAAMFANLIEPLAEHAPGLRHVTLLQGTKAYGAHARPIPTPAREGRDEARDIPNFYWEQEDLLRAVATRSGLHFTILRPQVIFGSSIGSAMNLIPALGVYGALRKARGAALAYPGGAAPVMEAIDAGLLARVIDWAGDCPRARDEVFNVTNGDVFRWQAIWPAIADALGMEVGEPEPQRLGETMPSKAAAWDALRDRHALRAPGLSRFVGESFHYADFVMAYGAVDPTPPALVSTVKLRDAGFPEVMDTELMFRRALAVMQEARLLPPR